MVWFEKVKLGPGLYWLEIKEAGLRVLCGCPADSVKYMKKRGLIRVLEDGGHSVETGPNAILLNDLPIQKGDFSNLSEFPILQIFYRQGYLIPGHHNFKKKKTMLIGTQEQIQSQLEYIFLGNYGLTSKEELVACGVDEDMAHRMMKVKLQFAFGSIDHPKEHFESFVVDKQEMAICNGVSVQRMGVNQYYFKYNGHKILVDLNLEEEEVYKTPLSLGQSYLKNQYFSIIHSGEGDGWDPERGCMGSIIAFNDKFYLVDVAPNIESTLQSLGICISDVAGVFQTHAHDDHFAGIAFLFRSPHKLKFFATPWVRQSVFKKLIALLEIDESQMNKFFDVVDLETDVWNHIQGLEVMPSYSPHPIETSSFKFRVLWEDGYKTYSHLADIASNRVMDAMVRSGAIDRSFHESIKKNYLEVADVKKIDIGGGLIHGDAEDFQQDQSKKVILAHTSKPLTKEEKQVGSSAPFGSVDILIPSQTSYPMKKIEKFFGNLFPSVDPVEFHSFLQCPVKTYAAGSIICKAHQAGSHVFLLINGNVERMRSDRKLRQTLLSGSIFAYSKLIDKQEVYTYRAESYVYLAKIPSEIFMAFLQKTNMLGFMKQMQQKCELLSESRIFSHLAPSIHFRDITQNSDTRHLKKGESLNIAFKPKGPGLVILLVGELLLPSIGETLKAGDFCCEDLVLTGKQELQVEISQDSTIVVIPTSTVQSSPAIYWQVVEMYLRRKTTEKYNLGTTNKTSVA